MRHGRADTVHTTGMPRMFISPFWADHIVEQDSPAATFGAIRYGSGSSEVFLGREMGHQRDYSEEVAAAIDEEVRALVDTAHQFIPGQTNGTISLDLLLDGSGATPSEFITITNWLSTPQVVTLNPSGTTAGSAAHYQVVYIKSSGFCTNVS